MMSPGVVLVSLLSLVLVYSAAGLECRIYVSSSDGINNTSCWTGGVQTPCATIDLAIQGTATLQYNCSSGILINLSPGTYTLDTTSLLEQQLLRNNVSIIGMRDGSRYEEVSITCLHVSSSSYNWLRYIVFECVSLYNCNNVPVTCTEPSFGITAHTFPCTNNFQFAIDNYNSLLYCYDHYLHNDCECEYPSFHAYIVDTCTKRKYNWMHELKVCIIIDSNNQDCDPVPLSNCDKIPSYCHRITKCFDKYIREEPFEITLNIRTLDISINETRNVLVTTDFECTYGNESCNLTYCSERNPPYKLPCPKDYFSYSERCYDNYTGVCFMNCESKGVPLNSLDECVNCGNHGLLIFIGIEILPITIMVLLIIIFNIQLTNGSINGVVFYTQLITINVSMYFKLSTKNPLYLSKIPCNIFNLDMTTFLINHPLCITRNMSPLGAISFWYVIGFYPLLLLLLLYVWITLYDKGYKCVVFITRPFHRCMARFWSMTGVEPSFTHSIASIYILCFTQLAATSFKILSLDPKTATFYYDMQQIYFYGTHGLAGSFAILVLLFLIVLPTLTILLYPFKWFQKLLDCLRLRKQLLISLGDVLTGPYKNGTENTYDYHFMAGLYLLARIIILSQFIYGYYSIFAIPISQACCSFLLAVIVIIFRPFQRNIHSFTEFLILLVVMAIGCACSVASFWILFESQTDSYSHISWKIMQFIGTYVLPVVNGLVCGLIIPGYIIYQVYKMIKSCYRYHKRNNPVANRNQEEDYQPLVGNDDDWVADRMENPQEYDERHAPGRMYDVSEEDQEPAITRYIATAATYGSIQQ